MTHEALEYETNVADAVGQNTDVSQLTFSLD